MANVMDEEPVDLGYDMDLDALPADEIYEKARDIAVDCNKSLHNSLRMIAETREIGSRALTELKCQGAQLEEMHESVQNIDNDIQYSERKIRGIRSIWGAIWNAITAGWATVARQRNRTERTKAIVEIKKKEDNGPVDPIPLLDKPFHIMLTHRPAEEGITTDAEKDFYNIADKNDAVLDDISTGLSELKILTIELGIEMQAQRNRTTALTDDITTTGARMGSTRKLVNQL